MNPSEAVERARAVIRRQHKTPATEQAYWYWLRHYMDALREMPRTLTSEQKLERFLTELALKKNVLAATQNQAFNVEENGRHGRRRLEVGHVHGENLAGSADGILAAPVQ